MTAEESKRADGTGGTVENGNAGATGDEARGADGTAESDRAGANGTDRPGGPFDYAAIHRRIDDLRAKGVFFIVGTPKSGTSWLMELLNGHPEIFCSGEGHLTDKLAPILKESLQHYNKTVAEMNALIQRRQGFGVVDGQALDYLFVTAAYLLWDGIMTDRNVRLIGDKTPNHTDSMPSLASLFPGSKFIHIIRDGRDVAVSGWNHNLRISREWTEKQYGSLANYARISAKIWSQRLRKGRAFADRCPERYREVRYEDLHGDPVAVIRSMLSFLGADDSAESIAACREAGSFERLSGGRKRGDEDGTSFYRKGVPGNWKTALDDESLAVFEEHAGDFLRKYGYA